MTKGLTILSQALCWGVSDGDTDPPFRESSGAVSPLSSATTAFQIATNGGSGSVVNETHPLEAAEETAELTKPNCPHTYPQAVDSGQRVVASLSTFRKTGFPGLVTAIGDASSVGCRSPFRSETAFAEANSFPGGCQPFCNIDRTFVEVRRGIVKTVTNVANPVVDASGLT
jgi:hypothetical protein